MIRREHRLTHVVKQYDPALFVKTGDDNKMYVIRNSTRWETYELDGMCVRVSRHDPMMVMALTDTWQPQGKAVDWGIEPILTRLKEIDSHRSMDIIDRINMAQTLRDESKSNDWSNKRESFARELRVAVKQDFKDYNVSSMDKTDIRKKYEIREKEGK